MVPCTKELDKTLGMKIPCGGQQLCLLRNGINGDPALMPLLEQLVVGTSWAKKILAQKQYSSRYGDLETWCR
jgi:hypothetical protein